MENGKIGKLSIDEAKVKVSFNTDDLIKLAGMASEIAKTAEALQRQSAEFGQACLGMLQRPNCLRE